MDDFGIKVYSAERLKRRRKPGRQIFKFNGEEITEWDLKFLYKNAEKLTVEQIAFVFDCCVEDVLNYLAYFSIRMEYKDRKLFDEMRERKDKENQQKREDELNREIEKRAKQLKRPEVVAIIGDKAYVDAFEKADYQQSVSEIKRDIAIEKQNEREDRKLQKYHGGVSDLTSVELRAIRAYRGLDRIAFSTQAKVSQSFVRHYELTKHVVIPKSVENIYLKTLRITAKELKKIRDYLAGKRDLEEEEDRIIPPYIRQEVWIRDEGKCTECGRDKHLHYHHIKLFSDGGMHTTDNLKLLCVACHARTHRDDQAYYMLKKLALDLLGVTLEDEHESGHRADFEGLSLDGAGN